MPIPTWVLPAPVLMGPGRRVAAVQLRELTLRFPPDATPGGALTVTFLDGQGQPLPDAVSVVLTPDDHRTLNVLPPAVLAAIAALLDARDVCDLRAATAEERAPVTPAIPTPTPAPVDAGGFGPLR